MNNHNGFVEDLNAAVRDNPVAAGLIGAGLIWMVFRGVGIMSSSRRVPAAARAVGGAADTAKILAGDLVTGTARNVRAATAAVGESVSSGIAGAATLVGDAAKAGYGAVTSPGGSRGPVNEFARHFPADRGGSFAAMLDREPLLLGAAGLAIGAATATILTSTQVEREVLGEASAATKSLAQDFAVTSAEFVGDRVATVIEEVAGEAEAQNLTPDALNKEIRSTLQKVKSAAGHVARG